MQYNFLSLLNCPPNSEKELFSNIKRCISIIEPEQLRRLKPAPQTHIRQLEELVKSQFGQLLPPSYKMYLQQMGKEDGDLLSRFIDYQLEEWKAFKKDDMAQGAQEFIEKSKIPTFIRQKTPAAPPFWYFYYGFLSEIGFGFSPATENPNQLIATDGRNFYFTHDTFSQMLVFFTYRRGVNWLGQHSIILEYNESLSSSESQDIFSICFLADCPQKWALPGHTLLVDFLKMLESQFAIEECWFSGNKEFDLFDTDGNATGVVNRFSRYVGFHKISDLTICVRYYSSYKPAIRVDILGQNISFIKQIVSSIFQQVDLREILLKKLINN